jgi:hypothetical protein
MEVTKEKMKEIIEQVIETKSEVDICEDYSYTWVWNLKFLELAKASYLSMTYYGGYGSKLDSGHLLPIEGAGFDYDKEKNIEIASKLTMEVCVGDRKRVFVDANSEKWKTFQQDVRDCKLKKAFKKRMG